jgi:hypothetical protein
MGTTNEIGYRTHKERWRANIHANYINHADFQLPAEISSRIPDFHQRISKQV